MAKTVIRIENVSKQYRLGKIGTGSFAHDVNRWWHLARGKEDPYLKIGEVNDRTKKGTSDLVWALRDISFDISEGDVVGIIGKNGAGKSTLLKILSRTTLPTLGQIKVKGRIASLLEVGTGFHPELTGKENIFLNGAILGMTKSEIRSKFDEIVDFSGVEKYIDTPVKRYSSGMYVRLAFAVAAHLDPEILIVDEVLAVGDTEFQKKALGKMQQVSRGEGRTVLFVSHNMGAIKGLCKSGIVLHNGIIAFMDSNIENVINAYHESTETLGSELKIGERKDRDGNATVFIKSLELINSIGEDKISLGKQIGFKISYESVLDNFLGKILLSINNRNGDCILFMDSSTIGDFPISLPKQGQLEIMVSRDFGLPTGLYSLNIAFLANNEMADYVQSALIMDVVDGLFYDNGKIPIGRSMCFVRQSWQLKDATL